MSGLLRASQAYIVFWFGIFQALRDNPKNCSGYCTIGLRDCNFGIFGIAHNCSGSGSLLAGHPGNSLPSPRIFPGLIPAARRNPVPGSCRGDNPNNCSQNPRVPGAPPGGDPPVNRLDKKIYLRG